MNIIINTPRNIHPITFKLMSARIDDADVRNKHLYSILFGNTKTSEWLMSFLYLIHVFELTKTPGITTKVKLLSILFYTISYNLLEYNQHLTKKLLTDYFISRNIFNGNKPSNGNTNTNSSTDFNFIEEHFKEEKLNWELHFGFNILIEIFEIIKFYLFAFANNKNNNENVKLLFEEIKSSLQAFIRMRELEKTKENFNEFIDLRIQRMNAKVILLIELALAEDEVKKSFVDKSKYLDIQEFMAFGKYIEINATLVRDYVKKYEDNPMNTYNYYKKHFDEKKYFEIKTQEKQQLLNVFKENILLMDILKKFESNFEKYYLEHSPSSNKEKEKESIPKTKF